MTDLLYFFIDFYTRDEFVIKIDINGGVIYAPLTFKYFKDHDIKSSKSINVYYYKGRSGISFEP